MASIPSNGYNEVMSGTNNYTGTNSFDASCPKTPVAPVAANDLCNKLYVDTIAGGGTVVAVSAGTNISVTGTVPNPVVNLQNPLTAELNVGTQSIRDRTGAVGTSGQVLTAGTGGQVLWGAGGGGGTVNSVGAGTNISITGTATDPIVNLLSPLTSPLDVGVQNITGTTGALTFSNTGGGIQSVTSVEAGGIDVQDTSVPALISTMSKSGFTTQNSSGALLTIAPTGLSSIGTPIDITPVAGQDCNVVVSGAGGLHIQQATAGGATNPSVRITNNNATTGGVNVDLYKNRTGATNDIVSALNFYGKDNAGNKTQFGGIESVITSAGGGGGVDGALDFYSCVNGGKSLVLRLNGADNENNSFRPLDMNGNNITTNTGNMTITTTASTGTGTLTVNSKQNIAMVAGSGTFTVNVPNSQVGISAFSGIGLVATTGGIQATANAGGINLTANAGGTIQTNTTGSASFVATTQMTLTSNTGIFSMPNELHYGKLSTPFADQEFRSTYQPVLTASTNTFPIADIQREGQQVIFINSAGDGSNELTPVSTPNFTITAMLFKTSTSQVIVGGYNHIQGRCEIRCGTGINDVVTAIGSGFFTYIAFPVNSTYFINVLYNSPLYPDTVAVGGQFAATTSDIYDGGTNFYPSSVLNFLCVDAVTPSSIVPLNMADANGFYGVDGVVTTINAQSNTYYTPASQPIFILGGKFGQIVSPSVPAQAASKTAVFCQNGTIFPFGTRWNSFIDADNEVKKIWVYDDRTVFGGQFSNIGGNACPRLAFHDNTLPFPNTSLINGFTPPAALTAGIELNTPTSCYFGCDFNGVDYPIYQFDLTNMGVTPSLISPQPALPAPATGFLTETGTTLDFIVGHLGGSNNFCYKIATPDFVDLNGATNLQNCFFTQGVPVFFIQPDIAPSNTNYWLYSPTTGAVSITTTDVLPFVSALAPANNWKTITLASRNNFATGTVVQFGTDDQRIVILASNGASFSN